MSVEELVKELREESARLSGRSLDRGCADSGISSNIADKAADKLEELAAALRIAQGNTDAAIEDYNEAQTALAEAKRENEVLKKALKKDPHSVWWWDYYEWLEARNAGGNNGE